MRVRSKLFLCLLFLSFSAIAVEIAHAKAPAQASPAGRGAKPAPASAATRAPARRVQANLAQVMRGILFPNANVIFAGQSGDPAALKPDADPSLSPNPLTGTYGGWQAIENSSLALAESASLLTIPGRVCSNGRPAPVLNADWTKFVQELRATGLAAYKAAQSKNQDAIVDISDKLTTACSNCHDIYREKSDAQGGVANRCVK
jgi:hypothetical protein